MEGNPHSPSESSLPAALKSDKTQEVNLSKEVFIYRDDVVISRKNEHLTGIVLEVSGDSDSDTDLSDSGVIDDEENKPAGNDDSTHESGANILNDSLDEVQVKVMWIDGSEKTENHSGLTVVDRNLLHGDVVASVSDPKGQIGLVINVDMSVNLLTANGVLITNVPTKELKRVQEFIHGDYVVYGPWLGRVDEVMDNVTVQFDDGSICKVIKADPEKLKPVLKSLVRDSTYPYYHGQRVKAVSCSVLKHARWLLGSWKLSYVEGTVTNIQVASVFVTWIASASAGTSDSSAVVPSEEQNPKNLTLVNCFADSDWQFSDCCLVPYLEYRLSVYRDSVSTKNVGDSALSSSSDQDDSSHVNFNSVPSVLCHAESHPSKEGTKESASSRKKLRKVFMRKEKKSHKREESPEKASFVVRTMTKVDVVWQDGTIQFGVESNSLIPIYYPGEHDFLPEQFVAEEVSSEGDNPYQVKRTGIVKSINAKEKTACVRWLKPASRPEELMEFDNEEVASVYELIEHPHYDYSIGDLVVRLSPPSVSDKSSFGEDAESENAHDRDNEEFSSLSWVGQITGLRDGIIQVSWADGMISEVGPQAVYVVGRDEGESFAGGSEAGDDAASWETVEENDETVFDLAHQDDGHQRSMDNQVDAEDHHLVSSDRSDLVWNDPSSLFHATVGVFTRIFTDFFPQGRKEDRTSSSDQDAPVNIESHDDDTSHEPPPKKDSLLDCQDPQNSVETSGIDNSSSLTAGTPVKTRHSLDDNDNNSHSVMDIDNGVQRSHGDDQGSCSFKHFDIAKDPLDHHFLNAAGQSVWERKWTKKIQKEWSILDKNLPDAIFVRVFEDRMDLVRAVIIGACGTPYQDGLFFFDFSLPPEYPRVPPQAYYHSGGLRINPNLYEEGKVCLSLLNTWTGKGNEVWDPQSSSILQVLVSIQGLVLNSKPYFNEAGYEKQIGTAEGEKNVVPYNENTYLLNLRSMLYILRRPPMHFEDFVKDHFRYRGLYILKACDAYMKGSPVGSLTKDACLTTDCSNEHSSVGFKLMLAKIVPKLFAAFKEVGAECGEFEHLCGS